ncbi:STAS-like domain-containing protein [Halopseudomonas pelagia]|uniref:STAS-like domain-containing protein n=1 Tax=Halopseudomonas pelagia TaxID=553151 RepID=UPI0003B5A4B6|nr:DUF4325 domain-containing protein [Halopseudomonas pelagia]
MSAKKTVEVDVGKFSKTPFGRYEDDGEYNGTKFRELKLKDLFLDPGVEKVIVQLDTVQDGYEYGSSFLEESFGGLVREYKLSADEVFKKLEVKTKYQDYVLEIEDYIRRAESNA